MLAKIDLQLSEKLQSISFLGTRFKDDYRIFCNSEHDAKIILKELSDELVSFNLLINESKTKIFSLPEGLYRQHEREYYLYSLKQVDPIPFKTFELTLLKVLDIHRSYPGTSLIEKFFSQLFDYNNRLKISFSNDPITNRKQILKSLSLLFLVKRESEKTISNILSIVEAIYDEFNSNNQLKDLLKEVIASEIEKASNRKSIFDLTWLLFFARYMKLGITDFPESISTNCSDNPLLNSIMSGVQRFFNDSHLDLFIKPALCIDVKLAKRFAIFDRSDEETIDNEDFS